MITKRKASAEFGDINVTSVPGREGHPYQRLRFLMRFCDKTFVTRFQATDDVSHHFNIHYFHERVTSNGPIEIGRLSDCPADYYSLEWLAAK